MGRGCVFDFFSILNCDTAYPQYLHFSVLPRVNWGRGRGHKRNKIIIAFVVVIIWHWYLMGLPDFKIGQEELQDGGRLRRGDHLAPHKYIRNTSTCGTTPTEHLLNAGRRPQTSQTARNSPCTWVGPKKKEQRQKNRDGTCTSGRELWRRKGFHTLGSPLWAEAAGGEWGASEPRRRAQQQGCKRAKWRDSHTEDGCWPALTSPRGLSAHLLGRAGLGAEARTSVGSQGEDWGWLREHSLKGASAAQLARRESRKTSGAA